MNLFYTDPQHITDMHFTLVAQEARHAIKVLRYRVGDMIHATDGCGGRFRGKIESVNNDEVIARIEEQACVPAPLPAVTLAIGMIKKRDRLEFAVEKAVELGAAQIIVFNGDRSEKTGVRMDRLKMTSLSAMKQSLRVWLPEISYCKSLGEVLDRHQPGRIGVADETIKPGGNRTLPGSDLQEFQGDEPSLIIIGPEGGFSESERERMTAEDVLPFSLGPYRLRTETAVVVVMSRILVSQG